MKKIKEIILHIGSHKTGTTAIQNYLEKNKANFNRHGVYSKNYFVHVGNSDNMQNIKFSNSDLIADYLRELSADKLILSNENYSWLDSPEEIEKFIALFRPYSEHIKVIWYIRRQDLQAISQKQEGTKWEDCSITYGHSLSALPDKLTNAAIFYLNYYEKYKLWSAYTDKVIVRPFERSKFYQGDLIYDFLHHLNVDITGLSEPIKSNENIGRKKQLFLHKIREFFPEGSQEKNFITPIVAYKIPSCNEKLQPSKAEAENFYNDFHESNLQLNQLLYPNSSEFELFDLDFSGYTDESNCYDPSVGEVIEIFADAIKYHLQAPMRNTTKFDKLNVIKRFAKGFENSSPEASYHLMKAASLIHPTGQFIKQKLAEYEAKIK